MLRCGIFVSFLITLKKQPETRKTINYVKYSVFPVFIMSAKMLKVTKWVFRFSLSFTVLTSISKVADTSFAKLSHYSQSYF